MIYKIKNKLSKINNKDKNIYKNMIYLFFVRGGSLLLALVKMPIYISFFNNQAVLGVWFTLISILNWILNFDLGVGNGLRNKLVGSIESKNKKQSKEYISSAYYMTGLISLICIVVGFFVILNIDWNAFFKIQHNVISHKTFAYAIAIVFIGIMLQFVLKLANSVLYAMQKSSIPGILNFISNVIILIVLLILNTFKLGLNYKLILMSIVYSVSIVLPLIVINIYIFCMNKKEFMPSLKFFNKKTAKSILLLGGIFFWIQIMYMVLVNTNEFLITWFIDPSKVVEYQLYNKIFSLGSTLFALILTPIWSMVTKAMNNKDFIWIKKTFKRFVWLSIIAMSVQLLILIFNQFIFDFWLQSETIKVNYIYSAIFALYGCLLIITGILSSFANGFGKLKTQFLCFTIGVFINIPLAYVISHYLNDWIGIVIANVISFLPYCIIQPIILRNFINKSIKNRT